jgi:hypothetical protein
MLEAFNFLILFSLPTNGSHFQTFPHLPINVFVTSPKIFSLNGLQHLLPPNFIFSLQSHTFSETAPPKCCMYSFQLVHSLRLPRQNVACIHSNLYILGDSPAKMLHVFIPTCTFSETALPKCCMYSFELVHSRRLPRQNVACIHSNLYILGDCPAKMLHVFIPTCTVQGGPAP